MKNNDPLDSDRIFDNMTVIFLNVIVGLSLLRFHWFILVFCLVVITEFLILNYFWRAWKFSLGVALLANIGSALVALPLLFLPTGYTSFWFHIINSAELLVTEYQVEPELILYFFVKSIFPFITIFFLSVIIEILIAKVLKAPKEKISFSIIVANVATYSLILVTLVGLGAGFGVLNQDPKLDSHDFFEGILFQTLQFDYPLEGQIMLLSYIFLLISVIFGFLLASGFIVWIILKSLKKIGTR